MPELIIYKASAGSGKTYTLALEYIKELLLSPARQAYRHVLAVTFTKDATGEMKNRILAELYGLAAGCKDSATFFESLQKALSEAGNPMKPDDIRQKAHVALQEILHDYSRLHITTIDSFFQKVLRNLARELGKGSKFNLEMNNNKVLSDAVYSMIENANENPQLLNWLTTYIEGKLNEGSNWRIEREILNFSKCVFDEHFQEHEQKLKKQLDENPQIFEQLRSQHTRIQKEAGNFFKKAYAEMTAQMEAAGLRQADFNRNGVVINFIHKLSEGDFAGANSQSQVVADCRVNPDKWPSSKNPRAAEIATLAANHLMPLLNVCMETLVQYNTSRMITNNLYQLGLIWDVTNEINRQNTENNRFMLADTARFLNRMIDDADAPFIYEKIGAEIKHVMIDEFQDTSRIQWQNFKTLLADILANKYFSLIVGDVKQSIYRWRNGDWRILNHIRKELPADIRSLTFNYRSEPNIVSFNNRLFTTAASALNEIFYSLFDKTSESPFPSAYDPADVIQQSPKKTSTGFVSIDLIPSKADDGKYSERVLETLLQQLAQLHAEGIPANEVCILTRTNRHIIDIATCLAAKKETHPALYDAHYLNIVSNEAFQLNASPAVRIIVEALRTLSDPENPVCKLQLQALLDKHVLRSGNALNRLAERINSETIFTQQQQLIRMPLFELTGHLFRTLNVDVIEGQSNYMFAFYDALHHYLNDYPADIHAFLKYWDDELHAKAVPSGAGISGVRAMTVHRSKGLQFHSVIVPFCDWSLYPEKNPVIWCTPKTGLYDVELLPVKYTGSMYETVFRKEYEEETTQAWMDHLNLLYVAFTRAEHNLMIIGKHKKKLNDVTDVKSVSDIIQYCLCPTDGDAPGDDSLHLEYGAPDGRLPNPKADSDNRLTATPEPLNVRFVSQAFQTDRSIFKQSNRSGIFIAGDESPEPENKYIVRGNVMHALFSSIKTMDDIPLSVDRLALEGVIHQEERREYEAYIRRAIQTAGVEEWFSDQYRIYNESPIILEDKGTITAKRPDRVLINDEQTVVVDYKFGRSHPSHNRQIEEYAQLMQQMGYHRVQAFLWYIEENMLTQIC
jgi:ATP-dependent exoDNAse (exonuclease V) beta subunit